MSSDKNIWEIARRVAQSIGDLSEYRSEDDPAIAEEILRIRAEALAAEESTADDAGESVSVVAFSLGAETYAVEVRYVRELRDVPFLSPVPCTPDFVAGIVNLRGEILSVVDLRRFLDLDESGITDLSKIIVLSTEEIEVGVLVHRVTNLLQIPVGEIDPPPASVSGAQRAYIKGVTKDSTIIIDAKEVLNDERMIIEDNVR